jgi:hypothetical protein
VTAREVGERVDGCTVSLRCHWSGHGGGLERAGVVSFEGDGGGSGGCRTGDDGAM